MNLLERTRAILIDWDDNAVETHLEIFGIYQSFAKRAGLRVPLHEDIKKLWGHPLRGMLNGLWPDKDIDFLEQGFIASVPADHAVKPFPGVEQTLEQLAKNYVIGVVSSTAKKGLERTMKKFPRLAAISYVHFQTGEDCSYHKPDPRVFDEALVKLAVLGINRDETIYVGDAINDLEAAKSVGLLFVATLTGFTPREEFLHAGLDPNLILENLTQLPAKLTQNQ
ncbi:MAG: HAD family hydrolase [Patescibacteria group bacterium]|nr:HAD family hydrolase [Patescibacteria group bacterium]